MPSWDLLEVAKPGKSNNYKASVNDIPVSGQLPGLEIETT